MAISEIRPGEQPHEGPTVILPCPTCKKLTPHITEGVKGKSEVPHGPHQTMKCVECGTIQKVYTGKDGKDFQANVDAPDDSAR
jgi:hypothetical protein